MQIPATAGVFTEVTGEAVTGLHLYPELMCRGAKSNYDNGNSSHAP